MGNKVFVDTNIILDIISSNRPSHKDALKIWEKLVVDECKIFISEDMLSTIFYINEDKKYALEFFQFIQHRWHIVSFGAKVIEDGISFSLENSLDFEDVLQCLCAKENGCDIMITNDKRFCDCGIKIVTIKEYLVSPEK